MTNSRNKGFIVHYSALPGNSGVVRHIVAKELGGIKETFSGDPEKRILLSFNAFLKKNQGKTYWFWNIEGEDFGPQQLRARMEFHKIKPADSFDNGHVKSIREFIESTNGRPINQSYISKFLGDSRFQFLGYCNKRHATLGRMLSGSKEGKLLEKIGNSPNDSLADLDLKKRKRLSDSQAAKVELFDWFIQNSRGLKLDGPGFSIPKFFTWAGGILLFGLIPLLANIDGALNFIKRFQSQ